MWAGCQHMETTEGSVPQLASTINFIVTACAPVWLLQGTELASY